MISVGSVSPLSSLKLKVLLAYCKALLASAFSNTKRHKRKEERKRKGESTVSTATRTPDQKKERRRTLGWRGKKPIE